ncbi:MAG TPA: presenilin family intramembrane aspartyl protease PSH [Thermoplasmata archaeon]|nr:presenilin family intramembrane aspartyl protease PSH [Thermoplasmata archaeon]
MRGLRSLGLLVLYVGAQLVALALAVPFKSAGLATSSNPNNPAAPLFIIIAIVVAPLLILWFVRQKGGLATLRVLLLVAIAGSLNLTLYYTLELILPATRFIPPAEAGLLFDPALTLAATIAVTILLALWIEPQWYVVDAAGFLAAGALIAILGISFSILPVFILLLALAVYDAIAVYGTKHMISLADAVTEMRLPILMVMPDSAGYDYTQAPSLNAQRQRPVEEREATFMGLGDVVIPGALVASAFVWLPVHPVVLGLGANLWAALAAMLGSLVGYALLMRRARSGNPQAGLPFLNGGALGGYIVAYLFLFHQFGLGFTLTF